MTHPEPMYSEILRATGTYTDEKYAFILDNRPRLIQAFPLKMIASYLKLTPQTLSRVGKSIMRTAIS